MHFIDRFSTQLSFSNLSPGFILKISKIQPRYSYKIYNLIKKKKSVITPLTDSEERQPRLIEAGVPTPWSGYRKRARKLTFLQSSGIK